MKRMRCLVYCIVVTSVMIGLMDVPSVLAGHNPPKGPEEFNGLQFKKQDAKKAEGECEAGGAPLPEFSPTVRDGEPNLALLKDAKPEASSVIAGWCPQRHCTEYLNDGFYNNCRSWIIGTIPGWAQIDIGTIATVNRVLLGSEHAPFWKDRFLTDFDILVATETADKDSAAKTWKKVLTYDKAGAPISETTEFKFKETEARLVRIHIRANDGARIDEIEIYGGKNPLAVEPVGKLTTTWSRIKAEK